MKLLVGMYYGCPWRMHWWRVIKHSLTIEVNSFDGRSAQLSYEQRVFVVETYFRTNSYKKVKEAFPGKFPERVVPSKSTIERNVKKYRNHATSLNRNKENSGRKRSARTAKTLKLYELY